MPSFTTQLADLQAHGPVVQGLRVAVGTPAEQVLRKAGAPVPSPVQLTAMIDTGATGSVIRQGVATQLGLKPVGVANINTASSSNVQCYQYAVRLIFPNNVTVEAIRWSAQLGDRSK